MSPPRPESPAASFSWCACAAACPQTLTLGFPPKAPKPQARRARLPDISESAGWGRRRGWAWPGNPTVPPPGEGRSRGNWEASGEKGRRGREMGPPKSDSGPPGQPGERGWAPSYLAAPDVIFKAPACLYMLIPLPCLGPSHRTTGRSLQRPG